MRLLTRKSNGNWRVWRAFVEGVKDGYRQRELCIGITWDNDPDNNEAYDIGANVGEFFAWLTKRST
mgnify:CR=1 FL=1